MYSWLYQLPTTQCDLPWSCLFFQLHLSYCMSYSLLAYVFSKIWPAISAFKDFKKICKFVGLHYILWIEMTHVHHSSSVYFWVESNLILIKHLCRNNQNFTFSCKLTTKGLWDFKKGRYPQVDEDVLYFVPKILAKSLFSHSKHCN